MRALHLVALFVLPFAAGAAVPCEHAPSDSRFESADGAADRLDPMNVYRERPGCVSIPRQVAGEDRTYDATRLDRLPRGTLLLAVEREVDGCPEVVLATEERRRVTERGRP